MNNWAFVLESNLFRFQQSLLYCILNHLLIHLICVFTWYKLKTWWWFLDWYKRWGVSWRWCWTASSHLPLLHVVLINHSSSLSPDNYPLESEYLLVLFLRLFRPWHDIYSFLFIGLKFFLLEEIMIRLVRIDEDTRVRITWDHRNGLRELFRVRSKVFSRLLYVTSQFLKVVLREGDLGVVCVLDSVQNRSIGGIKHVNR